MNTNSHLITDSQQEWWKPTAPAESQSISLQERSLPAGVPESKLPFKALLVFTFILIIAPQWWLPILDPLRLALVSGIVALVSHVIAQVSNGQKIFKPEKALYLCLALLAWSFVTLPFSSWRGGSISFLIDNYSRTVMVFILVANLINTSERLRTICLALSLMTIPLALTTIYSYVTGSNLEFGRVSGYPAPLTTNPNDMALLLNIILPFGVALFFASNKTLFRIIILGIVGISLLAVFATFSRGGFLTLGVMFLCYLWRLRKRPQRYLAPMLLVVVIGALPFLPGDYMNRISTIVNISEDDTGSAQERYADIAIAIDMIKDKPIFGSGIGMSGIAMDQLREEVLWIDVHNIYLQYGVDLGIPGVILFVLLLGTCINSVRKVLIDKAQREEFDLLYFVAEAVLISLIAFSVAGFFHPIAYQLFFYYLGGLALTVKSLHEKELAKAKIA